MAKYNKTALPDSTISKEGLEDLEIVRNTRNDLPYKKERRIPVGTFGIVTATGEEHVITWVENNYRKPKPIEKPEPQSDWMKYQLQTMFANWYKEAEQECQDLQVV